MKINRRLNAKKNTKSADETADRISQKKMWLLNERSIGRFHSLGSYGEYISGLGDEQTFDDQ